MSRHPRAERTDEGDARVRRLVASFVDVVAHLGALGHELDALRLASRQRRARVAGRRQGSADLPPQQVADALAAPANDERFSVDAVPDRAADARRRVDTRLRLQRLGEELADSVPAHAAPKVLPERR